jgi:hypothetical protein
LSVAAFASWLASRSYFTPTGSFWISVVSKTRKGDPIPAKFDQPEEELIIDLAADTGLSQSEIIRRSVRLLGRELKRRGSSWLQFLNELRRSSEPAATVSETSPAYGSVRQLEKAAKTFNKTKKRQTKRKSTAA